MSLRNEICQSLKIWSYGLVGKKLSISLRPLNGIELVHHSDGDIFIHSHFNRVTVEIGENIRSFSLPLPMYLKIIGVLRIFRRALRLDKSSIALSCDRKSLVITYGGAVYHYCLEMGLLQKTLELRQCRTVLHMSIASLDPNIFILGEYGQNREKEDVPIYVSKDGGRNWEISYIFPAGSIRHIHGVYHDSFTDHLWVPTGDFDGECYLYEFNDSNLIDPVVHGDGSQVWRTVNLFFTEKSVIWAMDSELESSCLINMKRSSGKISKERRFPGPVWYIKTLVDGYYLLQTTVENGAGVMTDHVHLFVSRDLANWHEAASFGHDGLPLRYFKNAVVAFSNGSQFSNKFYLSAEAIKGMDGKAFECEIHET
jgi:hypothetical protein